MRLVQLGRIGPSAFVGVRVMMGAFFLNEAMHQLRARWILGDGLMRMLRSALDDHAIVPPYRYFLEHVVLTHDQVFTLLVISGELAVGSALILGAATRLTATGALFMNVNFLAMNGATAGGAIDVVFIAVEVLLLKWAASQALSVDGFLARRGVDAPLLSGRMRHAHIMRPGRTPDWRARALGESAHVPEESDVSAP